ncbi:MAG: aminoglycoside phosphotransferase family protein [Kiritimatiellae bacterium]|nr:aminoglycoside phosphotransferase family protein [Kiritimatiellia bacterium]MDD3543769.1 aminoglycoside phosphotransferase family protein [Kiritimatiellia bacterium]MDD4025470.1 aminoglycoside phosphotransferase family protein [Kiritimatiellia bacterium]
MELSVLMNEFDISGRLVTINPTGNGNVNDTFLAIFRNTFTEEQVILQRINSNVFPEPEAIMHNLHQLTAHVHPRLEKEGESADRVWQMPRIVPTRDGRDFFVDDSGDVWRVITKIPSATAFDEAQGTEHAAECGAVLGHFHWLVSDLDTTQVIDPLPGFHVTPGYLAKYDATLRDEPLAEKRMNASMEARRMAMFVEERRGFAAILQNALDAGELVLRMMHGDPKVNNIMIDDFTGKGTAMIDLDTVAPGLIHYDFGDALRSICNHAGEEEQNLGKVVFDLDLCEAFCKGYMEHARAFLTDADRTYLYDAIRLITFELGLRFFQDYLAGSVYFKIRYPEQNLNRARVQFRLCESIESRERMIRGLLAKL